MFLARRKDPVERKTEIVTEDDPVHGAVGHNSDRSPFSMACKNSPRANITFYEKLPMLSPPGGCFLEKSCFHAENSCG